MKKQKLTAAAVALGLSFALSGAAHAGYYVPTGTPTYTPAQTGVTATVTGSATPPTSDSKSNNDTRSHARGWTWHSSTIVDPPPSSVNYRWTGQRSGTGLSVNINGSGSANVSVSFSDPEGNKGYACGAGSGANSLAIPTTARSKDLLNQSGGYNITAYITLLITTQANVTSNTTGGVVTATSGSANKLETSSLDLLP